MPHWPSILHMNKYSKYSLFLKSSYTDGEEKVPFIREGKKLLGIVSPTLFVPCLNSNTSTAYYYRIYHSSVCQQEYSVMCLWLKETNFS